MRRSVGNFVVEGDVVVGANSAKKVQRKATAGHRVRVINRTTLPYDIAAVSKLADASGNRRVSFAQGAGDSWEAQWHCLGSLSTGEQSCPLDVHGPSGKERLWTHLIRYRLGHSAIGLSQGGLWISNSTAPLPLELNIEVT